MDAQFPGNKRQGPVQIVGLLIFLVLHDVGGCRGGKALVIHTLKIQHILGEANDGEAAGELPAFLDPGELRRLEDNLDAGPALIQTVQLHIHSIDSGTFLAQQVLLQLFRELDVAPEGSIPLFGAQDGNVNGVRGYDLDIEAADD